MDNKVSSTGKKSVVANPVLWVVIVIVVIGIGFVYLATGSFVGCSNTENPEPLPAYSQSSTIRFDAPAYYLVPKESEYCSPSAKTIKGDIVDASFVQGFSDPNYSISPVDDATNFTLVNRVYVYCHGLDCMDAGDPGDFIILRDQQGTLWRWTGLQDIDEEGQPYTAAYYINGQRIDDVKPSDFTPPFPRAIVGL